MKSNVARRLLAGTLGLAMLIGDVFGGSSLAAYAEEATEVTASAEEGTEDAGDVEDTADVEEPGTEDTVYESVESVMASDTEEDVDSTIWIDEGWSEHYVSYGDSCTLYTYAYSDMDLTYSWYKYENGQWVLIADETGSEYEMAAVTEYGYYRCQAANTYSTEYIYFDVYVETDLEALEDYFYYVVEPGDSLTLSVAEYVSVCDGVELTYQWYHDSIAIDGATESSYTIDSASSSSFYTCIVTDSVGNSVSLSNQIYIESELSISASESNVYVEPGESVTVSVTASVKAGSLSYEWHYYDENNEYVSLDSTENADGTKSSVTVPNITKNTEVWCYVTDDYGNRYGTWINVKIDTGLDAETTDFNYYVDLNETVSLSAEDVTVNDGVELTYQWYCRGVQIEGATSATYTTDAITSYTYYECCVTDSYGGTLYLYYYVRIDTGFSADATWYEYEVEPNSQMELSAAGVTVKDGYTLSYQWYKNWSAIEGATEATCTTDAITGSTYYQCYVCDAYGNDTYIEFYLYIDTGLSCEDRWFYPSVEPNGAVTLSASGATANDGVELTYQWYKNWDEIEGATSATYTTEAITYYTRYQCEVSDGYGNSLTMYYYVSVDSGLSVEDDWTRYYVEPGASADLTAADVTADEGVALTYQWYLDGEAIDGATAVTYTTDAIISASYYYCIVSDGYGNNAYVYYDIYIDNDLTVGDWNSTVYMDSEGNAELSITATVNQGNITYKWYYYDEDDEYIVLTGTDTENGSTLTVSGATAGTWYYCRISDDYGNSTIVSFKVTVDTGLSASQNWYTSYVSPEKSVTLSAEAVTVNDGYTLSYQWYLDGDRVSGATDSTYTIDSVTSYHYLECQVTDGYGNYEYLYYDVYVQNNLTLTYSTVTLEIGEAATDLTVTATADYSENLTYYWYSYATGEYFEYAGTADENGLCTLPASYVTKAGYYYCRVSDGYGNSDIAYVRVKIKTGLGTEDGEDSYKIYVAYGETTVLDASAVTVNDGIALSYQWEYNWNDIDGATGVTLTTDPVTSREDYQCIVTDEYGNTYWLYFYVYIQNHLTVSYEDEVTVVYGEDINLSVTVSADDVEGMTYTWYGYDDQIEEYRYLEETGTSLTISNVTSSRWYECCIVDRYGNTKYAWFDISVDTGLTRGSYDSDYTVAPGDSLTLEVSASAYEGITLTYQWYEDYETIEGETGTTLALSNITQTKNYECKVSDGCGNSIWFYLYVYVDNELTLTSSTGAVYVISGNDLELVVSATVLKGSISYAWYAYDEEEDDYVPLSQTGTSLNLTNVTQNANYRCVVSDDYGNTRYAYFNVTVTETLRVNVETYSYTLEPGESATLSVEAVTSYPENLTYQWYLGVYKSYYESMEYTAIEGATGSTYTVNASDLAGKGGYSYYYKCVVSDGEAERNAYMCIYLDSGLAVESYDSDLEADYGDTAYLTLTATSNLTDAAYTFQWYEVTYEGDYDETVVYTPITSGVTTSGATSVLSLTVQESGTYRCVISDGYEVINRYFYIYVYTGLSASRALDSYTQEIDAGDTVDLKVTASSDKGTLSYQWYQTNVNGYYEAVSGAKNDTLTAGTQGYYYCEVSDGYNSTSVYYYVSVDSGFSYSGGSTCHMVKEGESVELTVTAATEKGTLSYQWYLMVEDGEYEAISGATAATYTVEGDSIGTVKYYRCIITDGYSTGSVYQQVYVIGETATSASSAVTLTDSAYASIENPGDLMYFKITPTVSGTYTFYSKDEGYTVAYLYDADMNKLKYNDGYVEYGDFQITYDLEAGKTYYLACGYYYSYTSSVGSFLVCMECDAMTDISECDVTLGTTSYTYDGKAMTPTVTVKKGTQTLVENTDYTVTYSDNINAGTATVTIAGIGNYNGEVKKQFTISKASQTVTASISASSISIGSTAAITASGTGTITYSSGNTSVATVNSSGVVTGVSAGTAVITVKAAGNSNYNEASKTISVTVSKLSQTVSVSTKGSTSVNAGATTTWTAKTTGDGAITYSVDNTSVATVNSSTGVVTAKAVGTVKVYAAAAASTKYNASSKTLIATITVGLAKTTISSVIQSGSAVTVKWSKVKGAAGYYVYRSTSSSSGYSLVKTITSASTVSYKDTSSKTNAKTYYYKVVAYSGSTKSADSAVKNIKYMKAAVSSLTNTSSGITVKWKKVSNATGYYIYRKAGSGKYTKVKTITKGSTVSWTDTGVKSKNGTTYTYYVQPYNKTSKGAYSTKKTVRLTAVTISSLKNSSSKKMTVKWKKNSKATGYEIQYSTSSSFKSGNKTVTISKAATTSKVISSLKKGKTYYVRIRTYKTVSGTKYYSAWSSKKSVKISK